MKTSAQNNTKTQLEQANDALIALSVNVTTSDRRAAFEKYSEYTVVNYLKGRGKDLDTATDLIEFFKGRITDRDKVIAA